ncbi:HAD family phosphatase [Turicibacter sp. TJ11]|uniref:HAD family hydrolase n=1 Tax=Turicibacter sp. TJ11 TaxID=2806443 RepID=UPI001F2EE6CC|nr:HAD family phosphatase [Turicibacter sp. TJ11]
MKKAIIFDMDGLLIDSERVTFEEYCLKLKQLNYEFNEDIYRRCLGKNKTGIYQVLLDHFGDSFPIDSVWDDVHVSLDHRLQQEVPLKKGIIELLTFLKERGYKTIVATSSSRQRADMILKAANLHHYFDDTICGDEVTCGKPNPEIFLTACEKLGVDPCEALVLEDSEAGIMAAHAGNIDVICVPDMKYPEEEFVLKTTKVVDSLLDVIDHLK